MNLKNRLKIQNIPVGLRQYSWVVLFALLSIGQRPVEAAVTTLFSQVQHAFAGSIDSMIICDPPPSFTPEAIWYGTFGCGPCGNISSWNVGSKTGWTPTGYGDFPFVLQRGFANLVDSSAVQANQFAGGFYINSASVDQSVTVHSMRFSHTFSSANRPQIWSLNGADNIDVSCSVAIKTVVIESNSAVSAVLRLGFQDVTDSANPKLFTINVALFDSRSGTFMQETANYSVGHPGRNSASINTFVGPTTLYTTRLSGSFDSGFAVWPDWKVFQFRITKSQFLNAVLAMNGVLTAPPTSQPPMSTNLLNYVYSGCVAGLELNRNISGGATTGGQIGGAIKDLVITSVKP